MQHDSWLYFTLFLQNYPKENLRMEHESKHDYHPIKGWCVIYYQGRCLFHMEAEGYT